MVMWSICMSGDVVMWSHNACQVMCSCGPYACQVMCSCGPYACQVMCSCDPITHVRWCDPIMHVRWCAHVIHMHVTWHGHTLHFQWRALTIMCSCDPYACYMTWSHSSLSVESINNYIGLGFSGYDKEGKPVWDVCKNIKVFDVEVSQQWLCTLTHFLAPPLSLVQIIGQWWQHGMWLRLYGYGGELLP